MVGCSLGHIYYLYCKTFQVTLSNLRLGRLGGVKTAGGSAVSSQPWIFAICMHVQQTTQALLDDQANLLYLTCCCIVEGEVSTK